MGMPTWWLSLDLTLEWLVQNLGTLPTLRVQSKCRQEALPGVPIATAVGMSVWERMSPPGSKGSHTACGEVEGVQDLSSLLSAFHKAELL